MLCHSGGCPGADMMWENECAKYGIDTIAYSFHNHHHEGKNPKILTQTELHEGFEHVKIASKTIKRNVDNIFYPYIRNLLARNWYQVKNSDAVFAVGKFQNFKENIVSGGTGWAVQMALDNNKPVFFFDQDTTYWFTYRRDLNRFSLMSSIPTLTEDFAGIGSRELESSGTTAIKNILKHNLEMSI